MAGTIEKVSKPDWALDAEDAISKIESAEEARGVIDGMVTLEHRLSEARLLKTYICEFCRIEATMWMQIATADIRLDGCDFTRKELNLVEWLRGKSADGLLKVFAQCARGHRIIDVKNDEGTRRNDHDRTEEYVRISDLIVSEGVESGVTTLNNERFFREWRAPGKPDHRAVSAHRELTKNKLLVSGCIGLGDGHGTYVSLTTGDREQKAQAVATRIQSILHDMDSLREICEESGIVVPESSIAQLHEKVDEIAVGRKDDAA